jgi:hypothetical protein
VFARKLRASYGCCAPRRTIRPAEGRAVIEVTCQTCGEKVRVQSFLTAAERPCGRCGRLLMGPLSQGTRTARPADFAEPPPAARRFDQGSGSTTGLWLGALTGTLAGVGAVVTVGLLGPVLPPALRGCVLGALTGVLLAPVLAVGSFLSMLILPFSLEGLLGDSAWSRLARALHERRLRPLVMPLFVFVVLPMALCALGGARLKGNTTLMVSAGLGAVILGATVGGVCGAVGARKARRAEGDRSAGKIDTVSLPPGE